MKLIIRPFINTDAEEISRIIIKDLTTVNVVDFGEELAKHLSSFYSPEDIIKYSENDEMYVGEMNSEIAGTVSLDGSRVRNVFVKPALLGKGIGKDLMNFIEDKAREKKKEKLFLHSHLSSAGFYEKLGYKSIEMKTEHFGDMSAQTILMEKYLLDPLNGKV